MGFVQRHADSVTGVLSSLIRYGFGERCGGCRIRTSRANPLHTRRAAQGLQGREVWRSLPRPRGFPPTMPVQTIARRNLCNHVQAVR